MRKEVTTVLDPASELPTDVADCPAWVTEALQVPREEGWIESGGCDIHYFRWGNPENPGLLLMHGFLSHARCFGFIAPFLAERYHVVAFDLSGMGDSGKRDRYTDAARAAEVEDVARATGLFDHSVKPVVIAHSYGGRVALSAMQERHAMFGGLIICDLMVLRPERIKSFFSIGKPLREDPARPNRIYPDFDAARNRFVLSPPQPVTVPCLLEYMAYHSLKQVEGGWTWKFDVGVFQGSFGQQEDMLRAGHLIAETPGRKAIVYGQESVLFDDDSADYVRECGAVDMPITGIPGAGHHLMLDEPIAFVSVLRAILEQWSAESA